MKYTTEQRAAMHAALDGMIDRDEARGVWSMPTPEQLRSIPSDALAVMVMKANTVTMLAPAEAVDRMATVAFNNLVVHQILRGEL